jgi:transcriptional regulator with XRE-family HTH domain
MVTISPAQCRAARALLDWQQRDLAKKSGVSKQAILQFERGRRASWPRTLDDLREAFEDAGVEFLDAQVGVRGLGVQMRDGFEPITRDDAAGTGNKATDDGGGGSLDVLGWDALDDLDEDGKPLPPLDWTDEDKADQIEHWRSRPEAWAKLHDVSRQCLLRAMGVDRL